ncbi:homoserine O-acetyltransferase [Oryzobacter telluris]|uniref:homoserine O-acetyltransferase MetX n=1 Tax=Oryzobacter telluris TaxID=3149179 RepID=UPI00370D22AF
MTATPTRTTGAVWRPGDPVGDRRFAVIGDLALERGGVLPDVTVAYETWGTLSPSGDNAVLVEHALTGDSHVVGDTGPGHPSAGWWPDLIGPGAPLDTDRLFVVASNVLGGCQGTTGPSSAAPDGRPWGSRYPFTTIRDQVAAEAALADHLGIRRWHGVLGGSMGGMRALEWATGHPDRVERVLVVASTAYATADQVAWCQPQLLAIRADPAFRGGDYYGTDDWPLTGMGIARRIAHTTYRHEAELDERFGRRPRTGEDPLGGGGRYDVESYLDHHATKLSRRFDPNSYLVLTEAMNSHDVGRGRGGLAAALGRFEGTLHVAGVTTDRLYPLRLTEEMAAARPGTGLSVVTSRHGHDGFLVETEQVGVLIREVLGGR